MPKAKAFFYVCGGIFLLALSYHFGARTATAQAPGNPVIGVAYQQGSPNSFIAMTANGDSYQTNDFGYHWSLNGNVFAGPTPAARETFGALKARYRQQGAAQPVPQDK